LFPRPRCQTVAWLGLEDPPAALRIFHALRSTIGDHLSAYELIGRLPLELALRHLPGTRDPLPTAHPWQVLVQVDDLAVDPLAAALETVIEEAQARGESSSISDAVIAQSESQAAALWHLRENLSEAQRLEAPSLKHDISLPQSAIASFITEAGQALAAAQPGVRVVCFGHLGDGNLHYNLFPAQADSSTAQIAQRHAGLTRIVHDLVAAHGGSFSAEHGIGQFKVAELIRYADPLGLELMHVLKAAWDPDGLMNPGKLFPIPASERRPDATDPASPRDPDHA
jgi:FAD/FMN-containing dehydrogenase